MQKNKPPPTEEELAAREKLFQEEREEEYAKIREKNAIQRKEDDIKLVEVSTTFDGIVARTPFLRGGRRYHLDISTLICGRLVIDWFIVFRGKYQLFERYCNALFFIFDRLLAHLTERGQGVPGEGVERSVLVPYNLVD